MSQPHAQSNRLLESASLLGNHLDVCYSLPLAASSESVYGMYLPALGCIVLQRVEEAVGQIALSTLSIKAPAGLYAMLGRNTVGLTEADIQTMSLIYNAEMQGKKIRTMTSRPRSRHRAAVLILRTETGRDSESASRPQSGCRSSTRRSQCSGALSEHIRRSKKIAWDSEEGTAGDSVQESTKRWPRQGVDETSHRETTTIAIRRLRKLMMETLAPAASWQTSSPLRMSEIRAVRERRKEGSAEGTEGIVPRLSVRSSPVLRQLGISLFWSIDGRSQRNFLHLAIHKWQVSACVCRCLESSSLTEMRDLQKLPPTYCVSRDGLKSPCKEQIHCPFSSSLPPDHSGFQLRRQWRI